MERVMERVKEINSPMEILTEKEKARNSQP